MAGRFLSRARGDANKARRCLFCQMDSSSMLFQAIKLMLATQEWKAEYFKVCGFTRTDSWRR